jgi:hypothetical protein
LSPVNWSFVAKIKIYKDRLFAWGTVINFIMLACLSLGIKLDYIYIIFLGVLALVVAYFDMKYILPREQEYYFQNNPEWRNRGDR